MTPSTYQPLSSVWEGSDADLLELMLRFYPGREPQRILDSTVNAGRFWKGSTRKIVGLDIDPSHHPDVVGDNMNMPFPADDFDVVVYDPPHIPKRRTGMGKDFDDRFGLRNRADDGPAYCLKHTYEPFLREAYRVLRPEGVLFCKIIDHISSHRYQWAHVDFVVIAQRVGFTACDCIIKVRKGPIVSPKWKTAHHSRRRHCYWLVFRKSASCE